MRRRALLKAFAATYLSSKRPLLCIIPKGGFRMQRHDASGSVPSSPSKESEPELNRLLVRWRFDEGYGALTREDASDALTLVHHALEPMWANGARSGALRFDGYSNWLEMERSLGSESDALSVSAWLAVPAYPVSDAPILAGYENETVRYFFGLDRYGFLILRVSRAEGSIDCRSRIPVPKNRWNRIAGEFDSENGLTVFLNGISIGATSLSPPPGTVNFNRWIVGRDPLSPKIAGIFFQGSLNGLIDELTANARRLEEEDIRPNAALALIPDLSIPPNRFEEDPHRPRFHPMPDANWTNEPHGLVRFKGEYHLFYQKNPNGPYWSQIHWGHLKSRDGVDWSEEPISLAPEPGCDGAGIWSGDCVIRGRTPTILYTGVDGAKAGVCVATSEDGMTTWSKRPDNPVISSPPPGFADFRDPFVWRERDGWKLVIGSGSSEHGGVALLYRSSDLIKWEYLKPLHFDASRRSGIYWEMPVFIPLGGDKRLLSVTTVEKDAPARALFWVGTWENEVFIPDSDEPSPFDVFNWMLSPSMLPTRGQKAMAIGIVPERRNSEEQYRAGWAHAFCLPRSLSLSDEGGLWQEPHPALKRLRGDKIETKDRVLRGAAELLHSPIAQWEIQMEFHPINAKRIGARLRHSTDGEEETIIYYDSSRRVIVLDESRSSLNPNVRREIRSAPLALRSNEAFRLHLFIDHSVIDGFLNGGKAFSTRIYPTKTDRFSIEGFSVGGETALSRFRAWPLQLPR